MQVVKQRENGRVVVTELRVIYGDPSAVLDHLGKSTSYIEHSNLTSRHFNGCQVRKTLAFSKALAIHKAAAILEDGYYNLIRPHKSLSLKLNQNQKRWQPCTPAIAAEFTDHIWTVKQLFLTIPVPPDSNT